MHQVLGLHNHILPILEAYEDEDGVHFIMKLCRRQGCMLDFILAQPQVTEGLIGGLFREVVEALAHCHSRGASRRSLRPVVQRVCSDNIYL